MIGRASTTVGTCSSIVWLRRDLRLHDNVALYEACRRGGRICLAFVLDPKLLRSDRVGAPIVQGFFDALDCLRAALRSSASDLALLEGDSAEELLRLSRRLEATAVFYNEDYEPDAIRRDAEVSDALRSAGIEVNAALDHVYFGAEEIETGGGGAYKVFTPYRRRWLERRGLAPRHPVPSAAALKGKLQPAELVGLTRDIPMPQDYGHRSSAQYPRVGEKLARRLFAGFVRPGGAIERYRPDRDFPALAATSRLSPHLRAGTIGIRECAERAFARLDESSGDGRASIETWIGELIWRDFYQMILKRFPRVATRAFLDSGDRIPWRDAETEFRAWCDGRTGYPIVDAAMRQIATFGWMHNRLRMIVASFLTKDLLVDWRRGERYFEQHLADADVAQNNGGWQWAASTGTDAAPYFRIFNPIRQGKTFDARGSFIRSMVPELRDVPDAFVHEPWTMPLSLQVHARCVIGRDYPLPIVDHGFARARALQAFAPAFRSEHAPDSAEGNR